MTVPVYKVLLVGEPNVGKSSLIRRMLLGEFDENYSATVGVDLSAMAVTLDGGRSVILTVIDLGGQEDFTGLRTHYYKDAHFSVLVYDIANRKSFESLPEWYEGLSVALTGKSDSRLPGILVGNKKDIETLAQVETVEANDFAQKLGWQFIETSAKSGLNVETLFKYVASEVDK